MNSSMKSMMKDALILFAITLIAGMILGIVFQVTKEPIAKQEEKAKQEACREVFPEAADFLQTETKEGWSDLAFAGVDMGEVMQAADAGGAVLGYVLTVTSHEGYGGDIRFMMGVGNDGTLNGISLLSISETAGLGMQAEEVLQPQFAGKHVESFAYTKSGAMSDNQIDSISGATITTAAITDAVNAGLTYFRNELAEGGGGNE